MKNKNQKRTNKKPITKNTYKRKQMSFSNFQENYQQSKKEVKIFQQKEVNLIMSEGKDLLMIMKKKRKNKSSKQRLLSMSPNLQFVRKSRTYKTRNRNSQLLAVLFQSLKKILSLHQRHLFNPLNSKNCFKIQIFIKDQKNNQNPLKTFHNKKKNLRSPEKLNEKKNN